MKDLKDLFTFIKSDNVSIIGVFIIVVLGLFVESALFIGAGIKDYRPTIVPSTLVPEVTQTFTSKIIATPTLTRTKSPTFTSVPSATETVTPIQLQDFIQPTVIFTEIPQPSCHPSYPDVCLPLTGPDIDCGDIPYRNIRVIGWDEYKLDGKDQDGWGCEE